MSSHNLPVLVLEPVQSWWQWRPKAWRVFRATWQADGRWYLELGSTATRYGQLSPQSWVSPWVMSLRWRLDGGGRYSWVLWRWQFTHRTWHALRLRLLLTGRKPEPGR